jgi:hypothetical protein
VDAGAPGTSLGATRQPLGLLGLLIATWGVLGVVALLLRAVWRLAPLAVEPLRDGSLGASHVVVYAAWIAFSIWAEGIRGFQKRFSPRVVARAMHLARNPHPVHALLAPLYCMALFHATRRGLAMAWGVLAMVAGLVLTVTWVPQPWRGIIDGGVVVGLVWGAAAMAWFFARGLAGHPMSVSSELPER